MNKEKMLSMLKTIGIDLDDMPDALKEAIGLKKYGPQISLPDSTRPLYTAMLQRLREAEVLQDKYELAKDKLRIAKNEVFEALHDLDPELRRKDIRLNHTKPIYQVVLDDNKNDDDSAVADAAERYVKNGGKGGEA